MTTTTSRPRRARRFVGAALSKGSSPRARTARRRRPIQWASDAGMATAEYAIATLAACGFAALLLTILKSSEVRTLLFGIIKRALQVG